MNGAAGPGEILLLLGATIVGALLARASFARIGLPSLIGYLLLGFCLRLADQQWMFLSEDAELAYHLLGQLGLFALLFKVGLKSNLSGLLAQLKRACGVWSGDVLLSGALGFATARFLLGMDLIPSVIVSSALTATSVGVSVAVWDNRGLLGTADGQLLTDVAELDDMTGVAIMALLLAVLPAVHEQAGRAIWWAAGSTLGLVILKLSAVVLACIVFSRYFERGITKKLFETFEPPGPILGAMGIGMLVAAAAAVLGSSLAIGAFLAGLAFSRDPKEHQLQSSFEGFYEFFAPFFFIGIGLNVDPTVGLAAVGLGLPLLAVAIVGKVIGVFLPASLATSRTAALLLGISMIPRAEIALVIMQRGRQLGSWAVPAQAYAAMVVVSAGTCMLAPLALGPLLRRWKRSRQG